MHAHAHTATEPEDTTSMSASASARYSPTEQAAQRPHHGKRALKSAVQALWVTNYVHAYGTNAKVDLVSSKCIVVYV